MAGRWRIARVVLIGLAAIVLIAIAGLLLLQTRWTKNYLRQIAERRAEAALGADVKIGALTGNMLTRVTLWNLRVAYEGQPIATIPRADAEYSIPGLLRGAIDVA